MTDEAPETIEIQDDKGNKVTVTVAHWNRWPQLAETFKPVKQKPTPVEPQTPQVGPTQLSS